MSDNFKWTDKLIKEYISKKLGLPAEHPYHLQQLEDFKNLKEAETQTEWEILSFISSLGYVAARDTNGLYKYATHGGWTLDVMLNNQSSEMKIHSVKRLPDGEVFTVGDRVVVYSSIREPIEEFTLNDGVLKVNGKNYSMLIESIKPMPKEYEILSIVAGGVVTEYTGSDRQNKLLDFGYPINSIKRLSDGEIFIIGDTLDEMEIGEKVITGFYANYKGNTLWVSTNNERGYGCSLGVAKKNRKVIFTTHDGIDVYQFDTFSVYEVTHPDFHLLQMAACDANPISKDDKFFVGKDNAKEYIVLNKPVTITYNELHCAIENQPFASIKDFFKSKIYP